MILQKPRFEDKGASLNIERKPGDVDETVSRRQIESRAPPTTTTVEYYHVVWLRRNLVYTCQFRTNINHIISS